MTITETALFIWLPFSLGALITSVTLLWWSKR